MSEDGGGPTPSQVRAGRGLLDMTQNELAAAAGVARLVVVNYEARITAPRRSTLERLRAAFLERGVTFVNGPQAVGVMMLVNPDPPT